MSTANTEPHAVSVVVENNVATVELRRPETKNSLRLADMRLLSQLIDAALNSGARCLLFKGTEGVFCAGRDLKEANPETDDTYAILQEQINPVLLKVRGSKVPTIAAVSGPALGFGFGLALACDVTLVADNAILGSPFKNIGAVLDSGGHYFLRERIGAHRAAELIFTGRMLSGREAAQLGLVNAAVGAQELDTIAFNLAKQIANGPTAAFAASKQILAQAQSYEQVLALESRCQADALAGHDGREGIRAFQEKRRPVFIGN